MSLLEDIFLQDEADEAQELERVIEGDEYDERPRSRSQTPNSDDNAPRDDEAEEDKRRVDPTSAKAKRVTKNPRFILNPARLTGPRGIQIIPDHFKDFKFKGKGHEKEDVDMILKKLEHWAYRLYPKFQFEDCLKKIESLGKKRPVMVHLQKIRTDQFMSEETVVQKDSSDEETQPPQVEDEFDKLLQQQIELARATPAPGSVRKVMGTPKPDRSPFTMPKATSSPSISDEQKERMIRNRKLAEERRLARLKQNSMENKDSTNNISGIIEVDEDNDEPNATPKKHNRSHVIESSEDECDVTSVNQAVAVDVHNGSYITEGVSESTTVARRNLDDVDMDEIVDTNNASENAENVIELIEDEKMNNDNAKLVETNDEQPKVVDEIIEINEASVRDSNEIIEIYDKPNKLVEEIIEINDKPNKIVDTIIEISDQAHKVTNEIIEIIDPVDRGINTKITEPVNIDAEEIEINDNIETIDNAVKDKEISKNTNVMEENSTNEIINVDNISKITTQKADVDIEQDIEAGHSNIRKDMVENDLQSKDTLATNTTSAEFTEDIMDVDFSDDF